MADSSKTDEITSAIRAMNARIADDERIDVSMLTVADGLTLVFKR